MYAVLLPIGIVNSVVVLALVVVTVDLYWSIRLFTVVIAVLTLLPSQVISPHVLMVVPDRAPVRVRPANDGELVVLTA